MHYPALYLKDLEKDFSDFQTEGRTEVLGRRAHSVQNDDSLTRTECIRMFSHVINLFSRDWPRNKVPSAPSKYSHSPVRNHFVFNATGDTASLNILLPDCEGSRVLSAEVSTASFWTHLVCLYGLFAFEDKSKRGKMNDLLIYGSKARRDSLPFLIRALTHSLVADSRVLTSEWKSKIGRIWGAWPPACVPETKISFLKLHASYKICGLLFLIVLYSSTYIDTQYIRTYTYTHST
jgi:hypothetical protein